MGAGLFCLIDLAHIQLPGIEAACFTAV